MTGPVGCTGVILAGGRASRYGGAPKGLELVESRRIIDRVADALRTETDDLLLVANDASASTWLEGVRCVGDVRPGLGGLGGIHAALVHARTPVLIVAWDMPFVPASLLRDLRATGERRGADSVVPESGSRRGLEPLCAYYGTRCLEAIERRLDAGDNRVIGFYEDVSVVRLSAESVAVHGDASLIFLNVNTPDDLLVAERSAAAAHGGGRRTQA